MQFDFCASFWIVLGHILWLIDPRLQDVLGVVLAFLGF